MACGSRKDSPARQQVAATPTGDPTQIAAPEPPTPDAVRNARSRAVFHVEHPPPAGRGRPPDAHAAGSPSEGLGPRRRRINEVKSLGPMGHRDVAPFRGNRRRASAPVRGCAGWSPHRAMVGEPELSPGFVSRETRRGGVSRTRRKRPARRGAPETSRPGYCRPGGTIRLMLSAEPITGHGRTGFAPLRVLPGGEPGPTDGRPSINVCPHGTLGWTIRSATDNALGAALGRSDRGGHHMRRRRPAHGSRFASRPSGPSPSENLLNQRVDRPGRHPASADLTALVDAPDHPARRRLSAPNTPHRAGFRGGSLCAAGFLASALLPRAAFEYRAPILRGAASALLARRGSSSSRLGVATILWRRTGGVLERHRLGVGSSVCRVRHARLKSRTIRHGDE